MSLPPPLNAPRIGYKVRDLMVQLIADKISGFNATVAAWAAKDYGVKPFKLDFGPRSPNVFLGNIDFEDIEKVQPTISVPMCMTIATGAKNNRNRGNRTKFCLFSGFVDGLVECKLAWPQSSALSDFDGYPELVSDVLFSIFNREDNQSVWNPYVAYDGDIDINPSRIAAIGEHWRQDVIARLSFGVLIAQ